MHDAGEWDRRVGDADAVRRGFEELAVPVVLLEGAEHRFVGANAAYRTLVGRPGLVGSTLREQFPEIEAQQLFAVVEQVYERGEPVSAREWRVQFDPGTGSPEVFWFDFVVLPRRRPDGSVYGVLVQQHDVSERVRERDAARAASAQAQRRYRDAGEVLLAMQEALLPPGLPVLPGLRVAGSYLLAPVEDTDAGAMAAGGDWFDAVPRPDGRVALVVGDVVGHGIAASATMGQLRVVLADRLHEGAGTAVALAAADRFARRTPAARAATVCVAELDPADGTLSWCTAGHPPPLVVPAAGPAHHLPATGAHPLGTGPGSPAFPTGSARLGVGDAVLLYTDGLLERPGRDPNAATVELAQVAADAAAGRVLDTGETSAVERLCTQTLELLVRATGHADDVTLLAAQRVRPAAPLDLVLPAVPAALATVRAGLGGWLAGLDASEDAVDALQHAVGELVTNAVEHAYLDAPPPEPERTVAVHATLTREGTVRMTVADRGRWRTSPSGPHRGRGLALAAALLDELHLPGGTDGPGTTVVVTHRLDRPARLLTAGEIASSTERPDRPAAGPELLLVLDDGAGPRIRLDGPLTAATAGQLARELRHRTRGGTRPLTVDLTGVTHVASAAVSALHDAVDATARAGGADLVLVAPAGSVAHRVLDLVALPHVTAAP